MSGAGSVAEKRGAIGLASPGVLHPGWYCEILVPDVDPECPGLYEWQIKGVGCYIGQYTHANRPRREYGLNVGRLLANRPYRKSNPSGFRLIHQELAAAVQAGHSITLTLLENHVAKSDRDRRECELIKARRADVGSGGLPVLNRTQNQCRW